MVDADHGYTDHYPEWKEGLWPCVEGMTCRGTNCHNSELGVGFHPCDAQGKQMEPDIGSDWDMLYVCGECGWIYRQD